jgi:hypothetical protein
MATVCVAVFAVKSEQVVVDAAGRAMSDGTLELNPRVAGALGGLLVWGRLLLFVKGWISCHVV